jgi:hypothetical protein
MGPRAGIDDVKKRQVFILPGLELRLLESPDRSQAPYWLRYRGSYPGIIVTENWHKFLYQVYSQIRRETRSYVEDCR